jgi:hypothetical protein
MRWPDFMWPMTGSTLDRRLSSRLIVSGTRCFWPEMKTLNGCTGGAPDRGANLLLHLENDGAERVAVIGVAGQRLHMRGELAAQ